jgi:hypothetical protein
MGGKVSIYEESVTNEAYAFNHGVSAKNMGDEMQVTIYAEKNGITYCGVTETWSVKTGILEMLETYYSKREASEKNMARCVLLVDMLYYGAEAQKRFDTKNELTEEDYVTYNLNPDYVALRTLGEPTFAATNTTAMAGQVDQLQVYSLGLEDAVKQQFVFKLSSTDYSRYMIKVTYKGTPYEFYAKDFLYTANADTIGVVFDKMGAKDMKEPMSVELYLDGQLVSKTYTASIEGSAAGMLAGKNAALVKAMMTYGNSVAKYMSL